jgi:hypothetical protein
VSFEDEIAEQGFVLLDERRGGTRRYTRKSNPFLKWWLMVHSDGTAELTWEFELGEYMKAKGLHVSVQDELSLLLFPKQESRGPADGAWLRAEIEGAERHLQSVDLLAGS